MSIRAIAKELYRVQQQVHQLEAMLAAAPSPAVSNDLREQLRKKRAEWQRLKNILAGAKISKAPTPHLPATHKPRY